MKFGLYYKNSDECINKYYSDTLINAIKYFLLRKNLSKKEFNKTFIVKYIDG